MIISSKSPLGSQPESTPTLSKQNILVEFGIRDEWHNIHTLRAKAILPINHVQEITDGHYIFKYVGNVKKDSLVAIVEDSTISDEDKIKNTFNFKYLIREVICMGRPRMIMTETGDVYFDPVDSGYAQNLIDNAKKWYNEEFRKS